MTKQQKIREWLAREFYKNECGLTDKNFSEKHWQLLCKNDASNTIVCGEYADKVLAYFHSQGLKIISYPVEFEDLTGCVIVKLESLVEE